MKWGLWRWVFARKPAPERKSAQHTMVPSPALWFLGFELNFKILRKFNLLIFPIDNPNFLDFFNGNCGTTLGFPKNWIFEKWKRKFWEGTAQSLVCLKTSIGSSRHMYLRSGTCMYVSRDQANTGSGGSPWAREPKFWGGDPLGTHFLPLARAALRTTLGLFFYEK